MLAGVVVVHWTKKLIRKIPGVGMIASPILDLLPTIIVGPALGAALVYGHGEGDLLAARHKVRQTWEDMSNEVDTVLSDLREEAKRGLRRHEAAARQLQGAVEQQVHDMEREMTPVLERQYRQAKRQLEELERELQRGQQQQPAPALAQPKVDAWPGNASSKR